MEFTITVNVPGDILSGDDYNEKLEEFVTILNEDWSNSHDAVLCFSVAQTELVSPPIPSNCAACALAQYDMATHDERASYIPIKIDGALVLAVGCEKHVGLIKDAIDAQK